MPAADAADRPHDSLKPASHAMTDLVLPATLTHAQATGAARMLAQALGGPGAGPVVVDGSALQAFDSSALAVLFECRRQALAAGRPFATRALPERLRVLASLYGVAELLPN